MHIIYYNKVRTQQYDILDISTCRIEDFMSGSLQPLFFYKKRELFNQITTISKQRICKDTVRRNKAL